MTAQTFEAPGRARTNPFDRFLAIRIPITWEIVYYAVVIGLAIAFRFWNLGDRALHHDESIHAQWSWTLLQDGYHHSPVFHGPFYYHFQALVFLLFGANDYTARVSAAITGTALVMLPLLLRRRLGAAGTMAAVAFLAFSPTIVYYSRFFREDIYMGFFTLLMAVAMWRYLDCGRERWLAVFAAGFVGNVLTKEGSFLVIAVFLVYLDVYLASKLARRTLEARELKGVHRQWILTLALAPWAFLIAGFWTLIGSVRRRMDWGHDLPRVADVLIMLGTLTLPLLTPLSRVYLLEPLHLVGKDQLNWETHLQSALSLSDGLALAGLFAITISVSAFVGLQWRTRFWLITFLACGFVYLTLMTSCWTNLDGLVSGPWGSLDYWQTQQDVARGGQPWFYYDMLMPMYEFLPLVLAVGGIWWSLVRGDAFSRFTWTWLVGMWLALSWGGEKMPWLNTHLAIPTCILAAWTIQRAWHAWDDRPNSGRILAGILPIAGIAALALIVVAWLPATSAGNLGRIAMAAVATVAIVAVAWHFGGRSAGVVLAITVIGALSFFSLRTMVMASFTRGDVPKDMLIYTQSSPQLLQIDRDIKHLATATGLGYDLPIAVDSSDSYAWPWAWYLRDYTHITYVPFTDGPPTGDWAVLLVDASNADKVNQSLAAAASTKYGSPIDYSHRWWFDETYKNALTTGPYSSDTWQTIWDGVAHGSWLHTWFDYWRDHDPHRPPGSANAVAYFPADFDPASGAVSGKPAAAPKPTVDDSGRPQFGGKGSLPGQFFAPVGIAQGTDGSLYVIDSQTHRLQKFDAAGNYIAGVDIRQDTDSPEQQSEPWGVAVAPNGNIVVADTFGWRIIEFTSDLKPTGIVFGQPPTEATPGDYDLYGPRDIAFDASGNMWVTDTGDNRIQVYTADGTYVRTVGSQGAGPGHFSEPVGLSIASDGTVFVADMYNARVELLNPDGSYRSAFPVDGWGGQEVTDKPYLAALADGRVAVGVPSLGEVRIYTRDGQLDATISDSNEPLDHPYGITETPDGKLWIVEGGSARVREFDIP